MLLASDVLLLLFKACSHLYFSQTLERSYLLKINGVPAERPQHMLMRVSVGIHKTDIDAAIEVSHVGNISCPRRVI